jgi:hypothetical protein
VKQHLVITKRLIRLPDPAMTGSLAIIRNDDLRNLMAKGAKYRESPRMSYS